MLKINNRIMIFLCIRFVHFVWYARRRINISLWFSFTLLPFYFVKQRVATSTSAPIFSPQLKSIGQWTRYECIFECIWIHFAMGGWFTDPEFSTAEKLNTFKANAKRLFLLWMDGIWRIAKYPLMTWFLFIQRFSVGTSARIMT